MLITACNMATIMNCKEKFHCMELNGMISRDASGIQISERAPVLRRNARLPSSW